ncbi:HAD family hydrolase [Solimonas variicoloris]|uniref:HAD family hydrolase n=1 Tax=Solimonas variicoloris TaxID=254408 RepID=UPI00037BB059|nr:HAD-IA family hydrolase [Solimonas variicoloris]
MSVALPLDAFAVRPRALLFDLDGTLVDTAPDLGDAANRVREELGLAPLPLADYRPVASAGARGLLGLALGITPQHAEYGARVERFLAFYRARLVRHSALFDGMGELLQAIGAAGLRWGVVTNKAAALTLPLLEGLALRADCAVSADQVPRPKPAPDSLLRACALLGLPPRACWYIGDDKRDIVAGQAAGMLTIAADWGYLGADGPITSWGAERIAATPRDIVAWLQASR